MEPTLAQIASTALVNASLAWTAGVLASRWWLMGDRASWQAAAARRLQAATPAGLVACIVALLLALWTEAAIMADVGWFAAAPAFAQMLATTHYGHAGVATIALLAIAVVVHWRLRHAAEASSVGALAVLLLLVAAARVAVGHAVEQGPFSIAVCMQWLHLLCMSLWTGIVFVAGWIVLARPPAVDRFVATYLASMSHWATLGVAGVAATGAYNAYRVLGSARNLSGSDYGHVLVFKLVLVLAAIALGGFNRFHGLPAAMRFDAHPERAKRSLRTIVAVLRVESVVLLLVLTAAAVLTNSAPPE